MVVGLTLHDTRLANLVDVLDEDGIAAVVGDIGVASGEGGRGEDGSSANNGGEFSEHVEVRVLEGEVDEDY